MVVYFDKENYISYLKTFEANEEGLDTVRMLKKQLKIHLNFALDELDEYEVILLEEFQTGVSVDFQLTHGIQKVPRPVNKNTIPSRQSVYLLNDSGIRALKDQHLVMAADVGEEVNVLRKLIINDDYSFHKEKVIGADIIPANHLDIFDFPFSTIVIVDRYMFKGPEIGGNLGLFEYNLDKFLKNIFSSKKGPSRLIFVYQVNVKVPNTSSNYDAGPDLTKLTAKIKSVTIKHCPAPELYFVGVPSGYINDEHDRYIFSNYIRIKSGDCLVYFDSTGALKTRSTTVDFYSLAKNDYRLVNNQLLQKIGKIIQETLDNHPTYSKVPNGTISDQVINFN